MEVVLPYTWIVDVYCFFAHMYNSAYPYKRTTVGTSQKPVHVVGKTVRKENHSTFPLVLAGNDNQREIQESLPLPFHKCRCCNRAVGIVEEVR